MGFPFLTIFLIFLIWLALRYHKLNRIQEEKETSFWEREMLANTTPAKDISNLSYITIPIDKFPLNFSSNPEVLEIENNLVELSTHKLLNLTGKTNTELKETYGVPNFETMSKIGEDFDTMTTLLNKYALALIEEEKIDDAINVLEFAVGVGTDVSQSYNLLADCYSKKDNKNKLDYLITNVENSNLVLKDSVLNHIRPLKASGD